MLAAELLRGVRRRAADEGCSEAALVLAAEHLVEGLSLLRLDTGVITAAGRLDPVTLRTLDAIHVLTAIRAMPFDAFVSYDHRQLRAAEAAGLPTASPGAPR